MVTHRNNWSLVLLVLPFLALLYPPLYARLTPELFGIPFFIWYQFLWVILGALIVYVVYALRRVEEV
jgi:hypothetical protein